MRSILLAVIWAAALPARGEPVTHDDVAYPEPEHTTACTLQSHSFPHDDTQYPDAEVVVLGCGDEAQGAPSGMHDDVAYPAREEPSRRRKLVVIEREEGLDPAEAVVQPGELIELVLRTDGSTPCSVTVNELGLRTTLQPNAVGRMTFTAPPSGVLTLECAVSGERAKLIVD